ncbi:MAG: sulfite exporter TauE/SafE family protein [Actinomycetia bacterium]|nr:sulfite exporter TauE/SafE family protein [Actinomycetes bacterium]
MSVVEVLVLFATGLVGGVVNSVSSGGSFLTYPAMLYIGLTPIEAATTTLAALTPANLAAVPEYWPEVKQNKHRYPRDFAIVFLGATIGIGLLFATGAEGFETLVPWLLLGATLLFAVSPRIHVWAGHSAPSLTDGAAGAVMILALGVYLTYFGSGIGNLMLAAFTIRGFGEFLSANAAKNLALSMGTTMAAVAYTFAGYIDWLAVVPVFVGSAVSARVASRYARRLSVPLLRGFVIASGLAVAIYQFGR